MNLALEHHTLPEAVGIIVAVALLLAALAVLGLALWGIAMIVHGWVLEFQIWHLKQRAREQWREMLRDGMDPQDLRRIQVERMRIEGPEEAAEAGVSLETWRAEAAEALKMLDRVIAEEARP